MGTVLVFKKACLAIKKGSLFQGFPHNLFF